MQGYPQAASNVVDIADLRAIRATKAIQDAAMHAITCHYEGDLVHTITMTYREMLDLLQAGGSVRFRIFKMVQQARPDLHLTSYGDFDFVIVFESNRR